MTELRPYSDFEAIVDEIGDKVPDTRQYQLLSALVLKHPEADALAAMDPFSPAYRARVMEFYLQIRGKPGTHYDVTRDEAANEPLPADIWKDTVPWKFEDPKFFSEFLLSWAQIFRLVEGGKSIIEYGAGTGQALLMLARMGLKTYAADIDGSALETIRRQSEAMGLGVACEQVRFGEGFGDARFDRVLFFESFHHCFEFEQLLTRLHDRINPGGRVILCGEPIVQAGLPVLPYPWGPRMDALSLFCIRRYGWMELGFTSDYFREAARRAGWKSSFHHEFPITGRAAAYMLEPREKDSAGNFIDEVETAPAAKSREPIIWRRPIKTLSGLLARR